MCDSHPVTADAPIRLNRRDLVRGLWSGSVVVMASGGAGCATVGTYFEPSDQQLVQMAAQAWQQTKQETPISRDAAANRRLQTIGPKIARAANRPNDAWEFVVFDSEEKNAFVLPGGKVGFYKGLLDFSDTDDQVAAVLGHEVGHVSARHAARRFGQQQATSLGVALTGAIVGATTDLDDQQLALAMGVLGAGATIGVILPFSRENEIEADKYGVDYMHAAGYDVRESVRLWEKMGQGASRSGPEWMSTHPSPQTRVQELRSYINNRGYAVV